MRTLSILAALVLATSLLVQPSVRAQEQGQKLFLELNNAIDSDGGCRVSLTAFNGTGMVLDKASYEVVVFDAEGLITQFLILEFSRLPSNKTKAVQFDLAEKPCDTISRLLINDSSECVSNQEASNVCLDALETSTRNKIEFGI